MRFLEFIPYYLWWHYTQATMELFGNIKTFLKFILRFFSISLLTTTLFSPWQRMGEAYKKGFEVEAWAETFVVNTLMRIVGFCIRSVTIVLGLLAFGVIFVISFGLFIMWFLVPIIWLFLLILTIETVI